MTSPTDSSAPAPSPPIELLLSLAALSGAGFDAARARAAVRAAARPGAKPMEMFTEVARALFMHADPEWMPLKDAIWRARRDTPVVLWSESTSRWIVITYADWYRVRIADSANPEKRRTVSRSELARLLGVDDLSQTVEALVIDPEYHSANIRAESHSANGEAHHTISPAARFFGFIRCERQDITTFVIYSVIAAILYLGAPLAVDAVVSGLVFGSTEQPYVQAIVVVGLALAATLLLHGLVNAFLYYISEIIQRRIFVRTAADLAHRLPRIATAELSQEHPPEVVNRFMDIVTLQKSVSTLLLEGVNLLIGGAFGMLLLALYHPYLMVFTLLFTTVTAAVIWLLGTGAVKTSIKESHRKYDLLNCFEEIAHFPLLFKGPGGRDFAIQRANSLVTDYIGAREKHFRIILRQVIGLLAVQVVAGAGLLVIGGYLVLKQQITLGQLVASELIMSTIVASLGKLGKKLEAWYDAMAAVDKLGHIVDLPVEREAGEGPGNASRRPGGCTLEVSKLTFAYHADQPLFQEMDFRIQPGERVALVGPHGSGASTLLDLLFGLREPAGGFITAEGLDLRDWSLDAFRREAQLLRRNEIVEGTVAENLRLGRSDIGADEIADALAKVGLLDPLRRTPQGLSLHLNIGGTPLSGSQRTRLLLARAIVQRPRLLLIDELLDGLDKKSFEEVVPAIFDKSRPWTVVVASRDPALIARCDRAIRLAAPTP